MSRVKPKAERGVRRAQALSFIAQQERQKRAWTPSDLAKSLGIAKAQAWTLLQSLTYTGELKRGTRTVVVDDALVLTEAQ